jgi:hypothetical protein
VVGSSQSILRAQNITSHLTKAQPMARNIIAQQVPGFGWWGEQYYLPGAVGFSWLIFWNPQNIILPAAPVLADGWQWYYFARSTRVRPMGRILFWAQHGWMQLIDILKPSKYYSACWPRVGWRVTLILFCGQGSIGPMCGIIFWVQHDWILLIDDLRA